MKKWKILVLVPYILIALWIIYWLAALPELGFAFILAAVFILYGIEALILYTVILGAALLVRWFIKKRKI
jgi:hypothetical protein